MYTEHRGRAGSINYIKSYNNLTDFPLLDAEKDFKDGDKVRSGVVYAKDELLKGVLFTVIASFRCMTTKNADGYYQWDRDFDEVIKIWDNVKLTIMSYVRVRGNEVQNSPDAIAKSPAIWQQNLTEVALTSHTLDQFETS